MTEDLLNSSVFSESNIKTSEDHYTLKPLCTQLQRLFKPRLIRKQIKFDFTVTKEMSNVPFFKDHTFQIASNLLSNAIKFTPEGGHVWVRLDMEIEFGHKKLCIRIADSGVGMDEKAIKSILSGSGAHTMGTTGEMGFGFGLIAVRYLIESANGTMKINSDIGKGTTFNIILPLV
ncbi:ATP-binding protein [Mucilaginibacter sp. PAMB04274]|uniref:sensor histidine kinase n=1 Tax=Mucilaginibacter sp. PAMB04274 TaxID=3138568 RepID=UPI0031F622ED